MTEPTTEPRTEAGRALLAATITGAGYDAWRDQILDIETEAREQAWSEREGYRLGFAAGRAAALGPDSIDTAWAAVEAVLPEGWGVGIEPQADGTYRLGTSGGTTWIIEAEGTTLAAALSYLTLPLSRYAAHPAEAEERSRE